MMHFINVGPNGSFKPSGDIQTTATEIDHLFNDLDKNAIKTLVLYFHGGLVPEHAGVATAQTISEALKHDGIQVVTFIWETGLGETVQRNFSNITTTELFAKLRDIVTEKVCKTLGISDGSRGNKPINQADLIGEFQQEQPLRQFEANARGGAQRVSEADLPIVEIEVQENVAEDLAVDSTLVKLADQEQAKSGTLDPTIVPPPAHGAITDRGGVITFALIKSIATVVIHVVRRFMKKTDHGLYPTIVEEILRQFYIGDFGKWVWSGMKKIAEEGMWMPNDHLRGDDQKVGTYFLERLSDYRQKHPNLSVDLIGHSAGSIAIGHLLKNAAMRSYDLFPFRNIVFMAPACTSQLFYDEILQHPERYKNLRMFTMTDACECQDQLVPRLYTRSLLYLVSGNFEEGADTPILGMQRYLHDIEPYRNDSILAQIRNFFSQATANRLVLSVSDESALVGFQSKSLKHGDFDNNPETLASLLAIISHNE